MDLLEYDRVAQRFECTQCDVVMTVKDRKWEETLAGN